MVWSTRMLNAQVRWSINLNRLIEITSLKGGGGAAPVSKTKDFVIQISITPVKNSCLNF